ncbi:MAG: RagB/SusD family nutrient uptake outer membrane protein [Ferruginibacter sp.]
MKKIKSFLLLAFLLTAGLSCKKNFLDEKPLDFLSSANAFNTAADFNASVNNLFRLLRQELYTLNDNDPFEYTYRTDIALYVPTGNPPNLLGEYSPVNSFANKHWTAWYKIVSEANTVISRIPASQLSASEKTLSEAKGRFFRAFAYRSLAYLYGGVPLLTEEVTSPKVDYVRATKKEVYSQCIADLVFAAANLPGISTVKDGELSNLAAQHLLSEVYISDGQFQKAVDAATIVINDPACKLMTTRFGSRKTEIPGDVYWDLFRRGNQNRKGAGANTESILVIQLETDVNGGAASSGVGFPSGDLYSLERVHPPLVRDVVLPNTTGTKAPFNWPAAEYSSGGRGVGFMAPSRYFVFNAYQAQGTGATPDSVNDLRNANHNFVRKFKVTTSGNALYPLGTEIDFFKIPAGAKGFNGAPLISGDVYNRAFYPYQTKCTEPFLAPTNLYATPSNPQLPYPYALKGTAGGTYRDEYLFRLAETYLLRAEAYLGLVNTASAAADINIVRARSNASPVLPANVNIDFILDERMREFGVEEKRMFTLMRLGKWYDRIVKCNPLYAPSALPKYNLWPIPQSEIERNRGAALSQNPGY